MPKRQDGDTVKIIILFLFNISFLPNYRVKDYDYVVKCCSGMTCNWCVSLGIARLTLALKFNETIAAETRSFWCSHREGGRHPTASNVRHPDVLDDRRRRVDVHQH